MLKKRGLLRSLAYFLAHFLPEYRLLKSLCIPYKVLAEKLLQQLIRGEK